MPDVKAIINRCEKEFPGCTVRSIKDAGECYVATMGSSGSKFVGIDLIYIRKSTGEIFIASRFEKPVGCCDYRMAEDVWFAGN